MIFALRECFCLKVNIKKYLFTAKNASILHNKIWNMFGVHCHWWRSVYVLAKVRLHRKKCNVTLLGGIAQLNNNIGNNKGNNKGQYLPLPRWYLH